MFSESAFQNSNPTHFGWVSERWLYSWILWTHSTFWLSSNSWGFGFLLHWTVSAASVPTCNHMTLKREHQYFPSFEPSCALGGKVGRQGAGEWLHGSLSVSKESHLKSSIFISTCKGTWEELWTWGFSVSCGWFTSSLLKHPEGLKSVHKAGSLQMTWYRNHVKPMISQAGK